MRLSTEDEPYSTRLPDRFRTPTQTVHRLADGSDHFYCAGSIAVDAERVCAHRDPFAPRCAQIVFRDRDGLIGGVEWVQQCPGFSLPSSRPRLV